MQKFSTFAAFTLISSTVLMSASADQPSLMQMIAQWQFPGSTMNGAQMSDGATLGPDGNRSTQSIVCKTVMTTDASVDEVLEYYKAKLNPKEFRGDDAVDVSKGGGRSVVFSDDSDGRPFAMHTIHVNTLDASTVLVITRGKDEPKTHIGWKHYRRLGN